MNRQNPIIRYDSPEAAKIVTVTGWVDRHGHFYGDNEHLARWNGATHKDCETCGTQIEMRGYCTPCHEKARRAKWLAMPLVEWDGTGMFCVFDSDRFFSEAYEFFDWCDEDGINPDDVMLVICEARGLSEVDVDHWCDELAEDHEPPIAVMEALEVLNKAIREAKPQTYFESNQRMILNRKVETPSSSCVHCRVP
jgi:hypothetical protein